MASINQLASEIAKREGKKSQATIGDIREILKIFFDITAENMDKFVEAINEEWSKRLAKVSKAKAKAKVAKKKQGRKK